MVAIGSITTDITERKQAEEELQKLSRAVEASSSIVIITDLDGNIEYVNPKYSEVTGYAKEETLGLNPRILKSREMPDTVYAELWETITSGKEWKGELHNRKKDGSLYWCRVSISCVKDAKGEITHYIGIQEDVTHEYELSKQLSHQATHVAAFNIRLDYHPALYIVTTDLRWAGFNIDTSNFTQLDPGSLW